MLVVPLSLPLPLAYCPQPIHRVSVAEQVGIGTDGNGGVLLDVAYAATSVRVLYIMVHKMIEVRSIVVGDAREGVERIVYLIYQCLSRSSGPVKQATPLVFA
jgi:hypothetical protein